MSAVAVSSEPLDVEWDAFVDAAPGGHHLQTSLWAQVKAKHGWRAKRFTVRRDGTIVVGCQLLVRRLPLGSIAYCPRGPLSVDSDAALVDRLISELAAIARRERILYVKVQPPVGRTDIEPLLLACGFVRSDLPATPTATVRIDLARDPEEILAGMRAGTRANVRMPSATGSSCVRRALTGSLHSGIFWRTRAGGRASTHIRSTTTPTSSSCSAPPGERS